MKSRPTITVDLPSVSQQQDYTCGAAALLAIGRYYGVGPASEREVVRDMRFGTDGSDPAHLVRALRRYRLAHIERRGMSDAELRAWLDARRPVVLMLQAWGGRASYRGHWADGHWVVAIGHDRRGVYLADPMIEGARGCVSWRELAERWHDVEGRARHHVERFGLVVWGPRVRVRGRGRMVRAVWPLA